MNLKQFNKKLWQIIGIVFGVMLLGFLMLLGFAFTYGFFEGVFT